MPKRLDRDALTHYAEAGYICPVRVFSEAQAATYLRAFEAYEQAAAGPLEAAYKHKLHLVAGWAWELVHDPGILDAVEDLLGPDLLCWTTNLLAKNGGDRQYVSWHQDAPYWRLEPHEVVTAWIALTPNTPEMGCMRVLPGSHKPPAAPHRDLFDADNMLTRGQRLVEDFAEDDGVPMPLGAGEISLHHVRLSHSSPPNRSSERRVGIAIRYMSADVQKRGRPESATLVRGEDRNGHFALETRPDTDFSRTARMAHNRAVRLQVANNYDAVGDEAAEVRETLANQRAALEKGLDFFYEQWRSEAAG
ncbi:MAG: phytanoyl-CoA dioxygenase family protein [Myxococcota bacterium]|nr:phytanoyl-CoA dioxygenase family protein [Myxococcota bacterium]